MRRILFAFCFAFLTQSIAAAQSPPRQRLLVVSIDGLDARYLNKADDLGMRIPTLRRLMEEGSSAAGVMGVVPTVTWPSHTSIVTGVAPDLHGILTNDQPGKPGQRWWFTDFLKSKTLWQAALEKNLRVAGVYWPVTVGAAVQFNLPEFWETRSEHEILFDPIARKASPWLVENISRAYPAFPRARWTDRSAMTAVRYLLERERPDLILVHIADTDADQHEFGAFSRPARAAIEEADALLGWTLEKLPKDMLVAVVSDHGFENIEKVVRPRVMLKEGVAVGEGLIGAKTDAAAAFFRARIGRDGIAREVPIGEVRGTAPHLKNWVAAFDTLPGHVVSREEQGEAVGAGSGKGTHGLWPTRADYRASFLLSGPGVRRQSLGEVHMLDLAPTFAEILGVGLPAAKRPSLWPKLRE